MEAEARRLPARMRIPTMHWVCSLEHSSLWIMSEKVGDLPMTEALQGLANTTPKYDTQKDIFKQSLLWLDSANTLLGSLIQNGFLEFSGDFYYAERISSPLSPRDALIEWQKVVNTYKLRLLIELSKKTGDADLNIAQQFATIYNDADKYPIFTGSADNLCTYI